MGRTLNLQKFHAELSWAGQVVFERVKADHPDERFYAFALYTHDAASYVALSANTEEALLRRAKEYSERDGGLIDLHKTALRWSPCDWGYHQEGVDSFAGVQKLLDAARGATDDLNDEDIEQVIKTCLLVLRELDTGGTFGTGEARDAVTINLLMGDQSDRDRLRWAKQLNPKGVYTRFKAELVAGEKAFDQLSE